MEWLSIMKGGNQLSLETAGAHQQSSHSTCRNKKDRQTEPETQNPNTQFLNMQNKS